MFRSGIVCLLVAICSIYLSEAKLKLEKATMSSPTRTYPARYAIDGYTSGGKLSNGKCALNNGGGSQQWWKAVLSSMAFIYTVRIFPRQDRRWQWRYSWVKIWTSASSYADDWTICAELGQSMQTSKGWRELKCPQDTRAKYIKITQSGKYQLALCEVEVYGTILQTPPVSLTTLYTQAPKTIKYLSLLTTLPVLGKEYSVSCQVRPRKLLRPDKWVNFVKFVPYSSRNPDLPPDLWSNGGPIGKPEFCSVVSQGKYYCADKPKHASIGRGVWHSLNIVQFKVGSYYRWQMFLNKRMVHNVVKKWPREFKKLLVFYGFKSPFRGNGTSIPVCVDCLRNLVIRSKV